MGTAFIYKDEYILMINLASQLIVDNTTKAIYGFSHVSRAAIQKILMMARQQGNGAHTRRALRYSAGTAW